MLPNKRKPDTVFCSGRKVGAVALVLDAMQD